MFHSGLGYLFLPFPCPPEFLPPLELFFAALCFFGFDCFAAFWAFCGATFCFFGFLVADVAAVVVVVGVVVVVIAQRPSVSPCARCAGSADFEMLIVWGLFFVAL